MGEPISGVMGSRSDLGKGVGCAFGRSPERRWPHLISLCTVEELQCGQNFLSSSRSVVLRRFFWVV